MEGLRKTAMGVIGSGGGGFCIMGFTHGLMAKERND